ncbi:MAG: anthranilate phosphoribosyltransferase, partial [Candidatus Thiodiazotropha sp. (ex Lucinoma borealis)]|nr:anthranilate phosphoribosyltransferase [Candidatus Thiodiazotropha sp. (ex Lucinoma borealis)]
IGNVSGAAMAAAETGLRALQGEKGPAYDSLLYSCALILWHAGRFHSVTVAADQVRQVLDSGAVHHRMR